MRVAKAQDAIKHKIETFPYKGENYQVKDVTIQWLSNAGPEDSPEYGLRLFVVGPSGEIPIHKHFYYQTMFILEGRLTGFCFDPETDQKTQEFDIGPHDVAFIPTMEPHGFTNPSDSEACAFLCCIANVYEEEP